MVWKLSFSSSLIARVLNSVGASCRAAKLSAYPVNAYPYPKMRTLTPKCIPSPRRRPPTAPERHAAQKCARAKHAPVLLRAGQHMAIEASMQVCPTAHSAIGGEGWPVNADG